MTSGPAARSADALLPPLCAAIAASAVFLPATNPDLWWHLSAGRWMARHGAVARHDFLTWTAAGQPWADFEWLTQLVYHGLYSAAGFPALLALRALAIGLLGWALWRLLGRALPAAQRGLIFLATATAMLPLLDLRPDNASLLLFCVLLLRLEAGRLSPSKSVAPLAAVAALFCLWANLHLGFLFGLALIGCYAAGEAVTAALPAVYGRPMGRLDGARRFAVLGAVGAAAALLNPFGHRVYVVAWEHLRQMGPLEETICEWLPADVALPWLWPFWALLAVAFACALGHYLAKRTTPYAHLFALFYFGLSASSHRRHIPYFCLAAAAHLAWAAADLGLARLKPRLQAALAAATLALFGAFYARHIWPNLALQTGAARAPEGLARFLEAERPVLGRLRVYNTWGEGGYLGFRLHPDYPLFLDGRYLFHPLLELVNAAKDKPEDWRALMDSFGIELALLKRPTLNYAFATKQGVFQLRPYFVTHMPERDWALVWWDERYFVMVRRSKAPASWLAAREYRLLRPDDLAALGELAAQGKARTADIGRELERHLAETGGSGAEAAQLRAWYKTLRAR